MVFKAHTHILYIHRRQHSTESAEDTQQYWNRSQLSEHPEHSSEADKKGTLREFSSEVNTLTVPPAFGKTPRRLIG